MFARHTTRPSWPAWTVSAVLALRGLRRNARRTILTSAAMILGGGMLIFAFSMSDGGQEMWIREAARMGIGHVTIERPEFRATRKIQNGLPQEIREATERALSSPEIAPYVEAAAARLSIRGLASSAAGARPVEISAVDPEAEARLSSLDEKVLSGRYLQEDDGALAYIGERLASSLRLKLGSRFVVQAEDAEGEIAAKLLRVVGIFRSGVAEADQTIVQIPLHSADEWLRLEGSVTSFNLVLAHSSVVAPTVDALERELEAFVERGQVAVLDWETANPSLASAIALDDFSGFIIQVMLFTIIAFGIMNAVLMSVLHRNREFGVLRAIGLTPGHTGLIVLIEGLVLTLASGVLGVGLGALLEWYLIGDGLDLTGMMDEMTFSGVLLDPIIVPEFRFERFAQALGFILVVGTVSSIYPAVRAARIDVTEVMQFDR